MLALIEGFARAAEQLRRRDRRLAELADLRERELEQFRGISEEWIAKEEEYKAEIKRLELRLARESPEGVASVALARQGSLVDRSGSKGFRARVERITNPHGHGGFSTMGGREVMESYADDDDWCARCRCGWRSGDVVVLLWSAAG